MGGISSKQRLVDKALGASFPESERVFGLAFLGATFWLNLPGIQYLVGGAILLFVLLCNLGGFGSSPARFLATAPSAAEGGYFLVAQTDGRSDVDFCRELAESKGVVCTPMSVFYSTPFAPEAPCTLVRFTVCKSEAYVARACEALRRGVQS